MTKRKTIEYIIESPILTSFDKLFMNIDQFQDLITIPREKLLEIQYKISNIRPLHDLVFYIIYNLKDYFLSIEDVMLFNEFYKWLCLSHLFFIYIFFEIRLIINFFDNFIFILL